MFECHVCGNKTARHELVSEVFDIEGRRVLVERVPANICERCGEATFTRDTAERVRQMLHSQAQPTATVPLDVFVFV